MTATTNTTTETDRADAIAEWHASASLVTYSPNYREVIRDTRRNTMRPGARPGARPTERPAAPPR